MSDEKYVCGIDYGTLSGRGCHSPRPETEAQSPNVRMTSPKTAVVIFDLLDEQHPGADTELHFTNAYELLAATILSAQSTDQRVNMVTPALFKRYPTPAALAKATPEELEPQIHSTGFFRAKSKALIGMAQALVNQHGGLHPGDPAGPGRARQPGPPDPLAHQPRRQQRAGGADARSASAASSSSRQVISSDAVHGTPAAGTSEGADAASGSG